MIIVVILSQVKVARALCQDCPVRYIVARASDLKDLLTMDQEENQSGFEEEEEAASPRMFLSGLWGIILGDSGFFSHFMKIGTGWQGTWRGLFWNYFYPPERPE